MKVCLITFQYPPIVGGISSAVTRISQNLARAGVEIHIVAPGKLKLGEQVIPEQEGSTTVHRTFPALSLYDGDALELQDVGDYIISLHQKHSFDLIHSFFVMPPGLVGVLAAKEIKCPVIVSIRGSDVQRLRYSLSTQSTLRWVLEQADVVTSVTTELLERAKDIAQIKEGYAVANAFDPTIFDKRDLQDLSKDQDFKRRLFIKTFLKVRKKYTPIIGTVGAIRHVKGFDVLLDAFVMFRERFPKAHLLAVGSIIDNERKFFNHKIKKLKLRQAVTITGRVPHHQVLAWMKEMDIFAFPSRHEGSPNALLEAMACGLPVVATQTGRKFGFDKA